MAITKLPPSPRPVVHHTGALLNDVNEDKDTVVTNNKKEHLLPAHDPPKRQSHVVVCINESANVEHVNTLWSKEDIATAWYSKSQLKQFKAQYRDLCRQIAQREAAMAVRCKQSWGNVVWRLYEGIADETDLAMLQARMGQAHGRIGMEWHATPGLASERAWQRQQQQQQQRVATSSVSLPSTCRALSQPSVHMAHVLALVLQETVLQQDEDEES